MKKIKIYLGALILTLLCLANSSCLPDTELAPEPVEGSIVRFRVTNVEEAIVSMSGKNINIILPVGSVLTGIIPEIIVSKGTTILDYTPGQTMDFVNNVTIKVKGTDNVIQEYLVKGIVKEPEPGFSSIDLMFEKKYVDLPTLPLHNVYSMAVSGENLLVAQNGKIEVYNANTCEKIKDLAGHPGAIHQITNDAAGRIIAISVSNGGTLAKIYKWENVNTTVPDIICQWTVEGTGTGIVGRNLLNVTGDITKDAVIYIAANARTDIYRWTITNGTFKTTIPEKLTYILPINSGNFPNITSSVNALGNKPEDGYTVSAYTRGATHETTKQRVFQVADAPNTMARSFVFDFNGAKYFTVALYNSSIFILDITKPDGITMTESQRFEAGIIDFKPFTSPTFPQNAGAANSSPHSGFAFKQNADGTAILYYLFANSGIRAYKLTPKK